MWVPRMFVALLIYIIVVIGIVLARPALMFDSEGRPKQFGVGFSEGYSVFAPSFMFPLLAMIIYIFVIWVKVMLK